MHTITRCKRCDAVVEQCRCPAKDKVLTYIPMCDDCKKTAEKEKGKQNGPNH